MVRRRSLVDLTRFVLLGACLALGAARCGGERPISVAGDAGSTGGTFATGGTTTATGGRATGGAPPATGGTTTATGGSWPGSGGRATGGTTTATGGTTTATGGRATGGAPPATGGAGGSTCGVCPPTMCKPGFMAVPSQTSCCLVCVAIDCAALDCGPVTCPAGMHAETPAGQCCPTCMPGAVSNACQSQRDSYTRNRLSLIEKYLSVSCTTDNDCVFVTEMNRCRQGCPMAFPRTTAVSADGNLNQISACAACPDADPAPSCAPTVPLCSNGRCTEGSPR